MMEHLDTRPTKDRSIHDQRPQQGTAEQQKSGDHGENAEVENHADESTSSSGSDESEEESSSGAESSSGEEDEERGSLPEQRATVSDARPDRNTHLQSRLREFLPLLQQANAELDDTEDDKRVDDVSDDAEHYIEMDLGLGVLAEQENAATEVKLPQPADQRDQTVVEGTSEFTPLSGLSPEKKTTKRKIEEVG